MDEAQHYYSMLNSYLDVCIQNLCHKLQHRMPERTTGLFFFYWGGTWCETTQRQNTANKNNTNNASIQHFWLNYSVHIHNAIMLGIATATLEVFVYIPKLCWLSKQSNIICYIFYKIQIYTVTIATCTMHVYIIIVWILCIPNYLLVYVSVLCWYIHACTCTSPALAGFHPVEIPHVGGGGELPTPPPPPPPKTQLLP